MPEGGKRNPHLSRAGMKPYYVPKFLHLSECIHTTDLSRKIKSGYFSSTKGRNIEFSNLRGHLYRVLLWNLNLFYSRLQTKICQTDNNLNLLKDFSPFFCLSLKVSHSSGHGSQEAPMSA